MSTSEIICVAFCANKSILPGLVAAISSLVRNCSQPERIHIHIFSDNLDHSDIQLIKAELTNQRSTSILQLHDADCEPFKNLKSLQGDWMTYFRLRLPKILCEYPYVLYLDSDLVINVDILELANYFPTNSPFGAAGIGIIGNSLEADFYTSIGLTPNDRAFNAGVIVFNTQICCNEGFFERCLKFAEEYPDNLLSADQTILNAEYSKEFSELPSKFNYALPAHARAPKAQTNAIFHFIGSPKPWDLGGRIVHRSHKVWESAFSSYSYSHMGWILSNLRSILNRTWTIRRSYLRELRSRFCRY